MISWQGVLIGLITGIIATLLGGNPHVRFGVEKVFRKLMGKTLISATLTSFTNYCHNGMFLVYCIELKNKMWLTPRISRVYLLSEGTIDYDSHAYKPFVYFRASGMSWMKLEYTTEQLLEEYSSKIIPYTPDNPNLGLNLSRTMPYRVVVMCELIRRDNAKESLPLNASNIVGELYAAVANPMTKTPLGAWWDMLVISEDFGLIDVFNIKIPKDLKEKESLGNSRDALKMNNRPPCLLDLNYDNKLTWPLRFTVNDCQIIIKSSYPREIEVKRPKKKRGIRLPRISRKREITPSHGIQIQ